MEYETQKKGKKLAEMRDEMHLGDYPGRGFRGTICVDVIITMFTTRSVGC